MTNPFPYGQIVLGKDACARPELHDALVRRVLDGRNVALLGRPRAGKSSLAVGALRSLSERRLVTVDFTAVKSAGDVSRRLLGALEAEAGAAPESRPQTVAGALEARVRRAGPAATVLLDAVQDVVDLPDADQVLTRLGDGIRALPGTPVVFAGTERPDLRDLFESPASGLAAGVALQTVGPLDQDSFRAHLEERFAWGRRRVSEDVWPRIFALADHLPGAVQQLCGALWDVSVRGERLSRAGLERAVMLIVTRERQGYEMLTAQLGGRALGVLTALARLGGRRPDDPEFLQAAGAVDAGNVESDLERLVQQRVVVRDREGHRFFTPFFGSWLRSLDDRWEPREIFAEDEDADFERR